MVQQDIFEQLGIELDTESSEEEDLNLNTRYDCYGVSIEKGCVLLKVNNKSEFKIKMSEVKANIDFTDVNSISLLTSMMRTKGVNQTAAFVRGN